MCMDFNFLAVSLFLNNFEEEFEKKVEHSEDYFEQVLSNLQASLVFDSVSEVWYCCYYCKGKFEVQHGHLLKIVIVFSFKLEIGCMVIDDNYFLEILRFYLFQVM